MHYSISVLLLQCSMGQPQTTVRYGTWLCIRLLPFPSCVWNLMSTFLSSNLPVVLRSPFPLLIAERGTRASLTLERMCSSQKLSGKKKNADVRGWSDWRKDMKKWRGWQRTDWDEDCTELNLCGLAMLTVVFVWQYCRYFSMCVQTNYISLFSAAPSHSPGHFLTTSLYEQFFSGQWSFIHIVVFCSLFLSLAD